MSNDELATIVVNLLKDQDVFIVKSVQHVNHKPHPYMIGPSHVSWAADHHCGMLSEDAIRDGEKRGAVRCYNSPPRQGRCNLPYDEHTSDRVLFLQLRRNAANKEASEILFTLKKTLEENNIKGVAFVDTPEKFRIAPPTSVPHGS